MLITSLENKKIKEIGKLRDKKYRDKTNLFLVETENLIKEAYKNNRLKEVYKLENNPLEIPVTTYEVTPQVMNKIKNINTSIAIGVCEKKESNEMGNRILLLDGIGDPGNLGTIIRSSLAFNIDTIILSNDCCDVYNEKTVRATEGAIFHQNIIRTDLKEAIELIKSKNIPIYGTDVEEGIDVRQIKSDQYAVIMGSEGNGISNDIKELIDQNIYIDINKNQESLNVGVATSIIIYELNRNRKDNK